MIWILVIGGIIAIVNTILTFVELMPFFKALGRLNKYTKQNGGFLNWFMYPFRFVTLTPKLLPLALDGAVALACTSIGLGGGVYGALTGLTIGFTASLLVKFYRHVIAPRTVTSDTITSWTEA